MANSDLKFRIRHSSTNQTHLTSKSVPLRAALHSHSISPSSISSMKCMLFILVQILSLARLQCAAERITDAATTDFALVTKSSSVTASSSSASAKVLPPLSAALLASSASSSTKTYTPVTQVPKLTKRQGSLPPDLKLKKTLKPHKDAKHTQNRTLEALSHDASERDSVVYLTENSGYVPVSSYRTARPPVPPHPTGTAGSGSISPSSGGGGSGTGSSSYHSSGSYDLDNYRHDSWDRDYSKRLRFNNTRVQHIEAECQDDYMKIRIGFNGSFSGLLYSAGYAYDPDCMYINGSGRDYYEFYIQLNRCGTLGKNALHDDNRKNPTNFMWNTVTVQYNPLIEEEFDEHFKVTCEYGYDFWKTVTFPFLDVEVATGNPVVFTLSPPECYMEIRNGYGIGGTRVTGPVRVGDPLTLIIYMRSKYDGFDIVVNDCYAHNGANKRIQLIDEYGCPVDDKLISRFRGSWSDSGVFETQVYAYMKTFRFTGSPALYIECDVRMCHGRCPSQPCHWRNIKTVAKREISNQTASNSSLSSNDSTDPPLSENVNLFQSLRVLQDGEGDDGRVQPAQAHTSSSETCMKTSVLSILTATFSVLICLLTACLMVACAKLRHRKKESSNLYDTYVNHKGQID